MAGKSWRFYHEVPRKDEDSLYVKMQGISCPQDSEITREPNDGNVLVYRVLNAKVFVRNTVPGMRTHTFVAQTDKQIEEAKSKIEELTELKLVEQVLAGAEI